MLGHSPLASLLTIAALAKTAQADLPINVDGEITVYTPSAGAVGRLDKNGEVQTNTTLNLGLFTISAFGAVCQGVSSPFWLVHDSDYLGIVDDRGDSTAAASFELASLSNPVNGINVWTIDCEGEYIIIEAQYNAGPHLSLCFDSKTSRLLVLQGSLCGAEADLETGSTLEAAYLYFDPTNVNATSFYPQSQPAAPTSSQEVVTSSSSYYIAPTPSPVSPTTGNDGNLVAVIGDIRLEVPSINLFGYLDDAGKIAPANNFNPGSNTIYAASGSCNNLPHAFPVQWTDAGSSLATYISTEVYRGASDPVPFTQSLYADFANIWDIDCLSGHMRLNTDLAPFAICFDSTTSKVVVVQDFGCHPEQNTFQVNLEFVPRNVPFYDAMNPNNGGGSPPTPSYSYNQPAQSSYTYYVPQSSYQYSQPQSSYYQYQPAQSSYYQYQPAQSSYYYASSDATPTPTEIATATDGGAPVPTETSVIPTPSPPTNNYAIGSFILSNPSDRSIKYLTIDGSISASNSNAFAIATPGGSCDTSGTGSNTFELYSDTGNYLAFDLSQLSVASFVLPTPGGSLVSSNQTNIFSIDCNTRIVSVTVPTLSELLLCTKGDSMMIAHEMSCAAAGGSSVSKLYFLPDLPSTF